VGTPGGTTIPTSVFQTIVNIIDFKLSTTDAVNKSKFHHQWLPDEVNVEKEFPVELRDELIKMGYKLKERETIGRTEAIKILTESSSTKRKIEAIADKRGDDSAAGY
jgi:gamma-glutamyltranspeptidase/glutathione hydrolase